MLNTLQKLDIFLTEKTEPSRKLRKSKIKILEAFFNYPQPMSKLEAQIYLKNMFDEDFNIFLLELRNIDDVRGFIASWINKNYFIKSEDQKELNWEDNETSRLKKCIETFLRSN